MKRPHKLPRRFWRYEVPGTWAEKLAKLSPRQQYIAEQSTRRWEQRHNAGEKITLMLGELGQVQGVRIIPSAPRGFVSPEEACERSARGDNSFLGIVRIIGSKP